MRFLIVSLVKSAEAGRMGWNFRNSQSPADIWSVIQASDWVLEKYQISGL